ncbi:hypothetical protein PIB30_033816 [Stylosanthes scabra]|uniref:F-box domain-containing protein n=1 Tax=Stylosanthes scabra TaxID=79078 RepID=A0ABU6Y9V7_9FABA|nr:hypothetical protein [Stylosanthes scabra]
MEQSSMENKLKCINDLLPLELILAILLRIPIKHLARAKCASKLWNTLIADLSFSKSHLDHSLALTHTYLFIRNSSYAYSINLDSLLLEDNHGVDARGRLTFPFKKQQPRRFGSYSLLGSCRGGRFSVPNFLRILDDALLYGFGYDASQDDYIVVVAYVGEDDENHFDLCCLGNNLWINLDSALPKPMKIFDWRSQGLFCNGAIHWYTYNCMEEILMFDIKERTFSKISVPEKLVPWASYSLVLLGGSLAMYMCHYGSYRKTEIWVMKEYKVQSS